MQRMFLPDSRFPLSVEYIHLFSYNKTFMVESLILVGKRDERDEGGGINFIL